MPVKRRLSKARECRITPIVIEAWQRGDCRLVDRELGIKPWQLGPMPWELGYYGVAASPCPDHHDLEDWARAQELRRELVELAGEPPACR
jgi:hypothetical protein